MKKRFVAVLLSSMMVASLAGCGSGSDGTTDTETPAADATGSSEKETEAKESVEDSGERPYYVRDENEVTGTITVYTTMEETQQEVLKTLWSKYYPNCEMEIQADSVGTLVTRIRGDETCDADVIVGGLFASDGDVYQDILQPYTAACDSEQSYHDDSGYYTYYDVNVMCLVVNPALRDELGITINGYEDLLNPELDGKIILAAPDATSSGWRQLQTILAVMGDKFDDEKGWAYIEKLIPMSFSTTSSKDVYNLVSNGEYVAGLSYEGAVVALINDGAPVECVYMEEGNTAVTSGAAIVKDAPNQAAAEAMMDLLSSSEFQEERAVVSSGRPTNGTSELNGLPEESTLGLIDLDFQYLTDNKEAICNKWNELFATSN